MIIIKHHLKRKIKKNNLKKQKSYKIKKNKNHKKKMMIKIIRICKKENNIENLHCLKKNKKKKK